MAVTDEKYLVTGAGGFIGSHLTESLLNLGKKVRALVSYRSNGYAGWLDEAGLSQNENLEVFRGDIRDSHQAESLLDGITGVFHLAALIGIPYSFDAPYSYLSTNVLGTHNLLEAARRQDVSFFIHTSTSEVYGTASFIPMSELHPINPQSPYAASKVAADALVNSYHHSFDLPVAIIRPFNTFGPRQSTRAVIPTILTQLLESETGKIELGNLSARRDFTFVSDTVRGFILGAQEINKAAGLTINLGAGWDISVGELAELCAAVTKRSLTIEGADLRLRPNTSEVERLLSDNARAKEVIGWAPIRSQEGAFPQALEETADWIAANLARGSTSFRGYHK